MGLFFAGRIIQDETVLKHLLGKGIQPISICDDKDKANYDCENFDNRIWLWSNLKTGYTIATGDEGNGWAVELAKGTRKEVLDKLYKLNPSRRKQELRIKSKYQNFVEVLEAWNGDVR